MAVKVSKEKIQFRMESVVRRAITSRTLLNDIANFLKDRIYSYTKRGYSMGALLTSNKTGRAIGSPRKLKPLSPNYIRNRRDMVKEKAKSFKTGITFKNNPRAARKRAISKFGPFFSPARSNLTLTGEMLEALTTSVDPKNATFTVSIDPSTRSDGENNAEVAKKVAKNGRPFLGIDEKGKEIIIRMIQASLRRSLKR